MIKVNIKFFKSGKGLYSCRFHINNQRFVKALKTYNRMEADKLADEYAEEVARELRLGTHTLGSVIHSYLNFQRDKTTHDTDKFRLELFYKKFGNVSMSNISKEECRDFYLDLIRTPSLRTGKIMGDTTKRSYLITYKSFMNFAMGDGKIDFNPFDFYKKGQSPRYQPKGRVFSELEISQIHKVLKGINQDRTKSLLWRQFYYFFLLMYYSGARPREIYHIKWADFSILDEQRVRFVVSAEYAKNKKSRNVEIPKWVWEEVSKVVKLNGYNKQEFVFDLVRRSSDVFGGKLWHTVRDKAGVGEGRLYDTRHTYITDKIRNGINPATVGEQVGHSSISKMTLDVYTHSSEQDRKVLVGKSKKIG